MRRYGWPVFGAVMFAACSGGGGGGDGGGDHTPPPVVGPASCDPLAQTGCGAGQKCTWIRVHESVGATGCVPEGDASEGDSCTFGPDGEKTGYDDCAGGLVCIGAGSQEAPGTCKAICSEFDSAGCGEAGACKRYAGLFPDSGASLGVCEPTCDPNTQVRLSDSAPACGSPDPSAPTLGCYGMPSTGSLRTTFSCVPVIDPDKTHGDPAENEFGHTYVNSCAPGYLPLLVESPGSTTVICVALCTPVESYQGNAAGRQGAAPHRCPDRGATAETEECRFLSWLESEFTPVSTISSTVGFCFDHARYTWDHDGDPETAVVSYPSCADLPNTDTNGDGVAEHVAWGCAPRPAP